LQAKPSLRTPHPPLLAKSERRVVFALQKNNVLTLADRVGGRAQFLGRCRLHHPYLHDRDRGDERGDEARSRSPRECVIDADATEVGRELLDQLLRSLREQVTERSSRPLDPVPPRL